ncbi:nuclear transport factor 2 family protein [Novosphingobium sp. PS1R-30]|uniref:Nuclear transport factor 2 family protein n=1 Tax=Novosphingobium anseongense TaxID=3133436 RepID=A0ABU8S2E4_9SPHN
MNDFHLRDCAAITDLVHTYALHVRSGEGQACCALFTEDAVFEMHVLDPADMSLKLHKRLEGRDAVIGHIAGATSPNARILPMIHNLIVEVDGTQASSTCAMSAVTIPDGIDLFGEYSDSFRFTDRWLFSARRHTILLQRPSGSARHLAGGSER